MYIKNIFLISISLVIIAQAVEQPLEINSAYSLKAHTTKLESELQPECAESTYIRVIVWNTIPTVKHLQYHFDKFDVLKVEEQQLEHGKFDIIEKSASTYERFLYAYSTEKQLTVTIFVKVNFNSERDPSAMKYFITKVNCALIKYGFIDKGDIECDKIHSKSLTVVIPVIALIVIAAFLWFKDSILIFFYKHVGSIFSKMGAYRQALSLYEKELEIQQKLLPRNYSNLASLYNTIASVYFKMHDYRKALEFYETELEIQQKLLPRNYPNLASLYNTIASVYFKMHDYRKALEFYETELEIQQKLLPRNYPNLASLYNTIASVYFRLNNNQTAISFSKNAVKIGRESLAPNNPQLEMYEKNLENLQNSNFTECFLDCEPLRN